MIENEQTKSPKDQYVEEMIYLGKAWGISNEVIRECLESFYNYKPNKRKLNGGN